MELRKIRPFTRKVKGLNKKGLVGCELGVRHGYNAKNMLRHLDIEKLYLVDTNFLKIIQDSRVVNIVGRSDVVFDQIPEGLDFCYIDTTPHSRENVSKEIELYYPKMKEGGVIGGHDFVGKYGVPFAVCEFCNIHGLRLGGRRDDWWLRKGYK